MPFYPRRRRIVRGSRKPTVGTRVYRKKRVYAKKSVQSRTHVIKRLGKPAFLRNDLTTGVPLLAADAGGTMFFSAPTPGIMNGVWEVGMANQFQLDSVIDYTDLTQLFDRYKIIGVKLKFHYLVSSGMNVGQSNLPTIHYAFDGDDSASPVSPTDVLSKAYCKTRVLNANRPVSVYYKPRMSKNVFISPTLFATSTERAGWLDCNYPQVPHYGVKIWMSDWVGGADNNNGLRIQPTYYLALKDSQ